MPEGMKAKSATQIEVTAKLSAGLIGKFRFPPDEIGHFLKR